LIPFDEIGLLRGGFSNAGAAAALCPGFLGRLYLDLAARLVYVAAPGRMNIV
jgi:hypothetical protein